MGQNILEQYNDTSLSTISRYDNCNVQYLRIMYVSRVKARFRMCVRSLSLTKKKKKKKNICFKRSHLKVHLFCCALEKPKLDPNKILR